jgi:hypothetical protein
MIDVFGAGLTNAGAMAFRCNGHLGVSEAGVDVCRTDEKGLIGYPMLLYTSEYAHRRGCRHV